VKSSAAGGVVLLLIIGDTDSLTVLLAIYGRLSFLVTITNKEAST